MKEHEKRGSYENRNSYFSLLPVFDFLRLCITYILSGISFSLKEDYVYLENISRHYLHALHLQASVV